jgi:hypothetical protein
MDAGSTAPYLAAIGVRTAARWYPLERGGDPGEMTGITHY